MEYILCHFGHTNILIRGTSLKQRSLSQECITYLGRNQDERNKDVFKRTTMLIVIDKVVVLKSKNLHNFLIPQCKLLLWYSLEASL